MPFGPEGLVVTWVGPVPNLARVSYDDGHLFAQFEKLYGHEIPQQFPEKYLKDLQQVELFNANMSWDIPELTRWQKRHGIEMEERPTRIFEDYIRRNNTIFSTLVEHPKVIDPSKWKRCSVVLQRAVIVYADGQETLYLRSYFHSAKDSDNFVNFVPRGGLRISFASEAIWFPLELTNLISEPASYVVLDVLTSAPLDPGQAPKAFKVDRGGRMWHKGRLFHVSRLTARLEANQRWPDLRLSPSGPPQK